MIEESLVGGRSSKRLCRRPSNSGSTVAAQAANEILLQLNEASSASASQDGGNSGSSSRMEVDDDHGAYCQQADEDHDSTMATTKRVKVVPKLTESDAKRQIQLIYRTPACWRSDSDQSHLLYLLQQFPALASQFFDWDYNLFWEHGNEWSSPLSFLLAAGANLETIQAVYTLYPPAISQPSGIHRDLPLHFACRFGVSEEIVFFLLSKFPLAVAVSNASGMLPIHCALGKKDIFPYGSFRHASLETVKLLIETYPQSLLKEESDKNYTPLQIAFNHGYSFEVLDYMMSRLPDEMGDFKLVAGCYHKLFTVELDLAESELVSKLISKLHHFHCEPTLWSRDGLVQMLTYLQGNVTICDFKASNLTAELLSHDSVVAALTSLLRQNKTIETLGLSIRAAAEDDEEGNNDASHFLQTLESCLSRNNSLQTMELCNFTVTASSLSRFLASEYAPKDVTLRNFVFLPDALPNNNVKQKYCIPHSNSRVHKLVISNCRLQQQAANPPTTTATQTNTSPIQTILHCVARMPQLRDLTLLLSHSKDLDITEPLVQLLQPPSVIESLTVRGPNVKMEPLCVTFQTNATLKRFDFPRSLETKASRACFVDTLDNCNTTLNYVRVAGFKNFKDEVECKRIAYLTRLNQFGRAQLRIPNVTKASLVHILNDFDRLSPDCCQPQDKLAVTFGLLREAPSIWCS